jgi:hypothetical protein
MNLRITIEKQNLSIGRKCCVELNEEIEKLQKTLF